MIGKLRNMTAIKACVQKVEVLIIENNGNSSWKSEYEMAKDVLFR